MAPQFTSFNPYQQQAEQEAAQAEFLRQQQVFMLQQQQAQQQQQQEEWMRQQQLLQMQQQQQQQQAQQSLFAPQQLQPQPTGFGYVPAVIQIIMRYIDDSTHRNNNPFAPASPSSFSPSPQPQQHNQPAFNLGGTYDNHSQSHLSSLSSSPQPPTNQQQQSNQGRPFAVKTKKEQENEALAALFADREGGQDTFGNVGALRCVLFFSRVFS